MSKNTQISELINYISVDGSGNIVFTTVPAATTNTNKFLVSDTGVLKFRTAAQLLSDIGAQASLTNPVTGTGTNGQIAYWSSASAITGEANLFWDSTNDRLGIGTATPDSKIHAYVSSGSIQTLLKLENASATASSGTKISFTEGGVERAAIISQINTGTTPYLSFENNGSERWRITSTGVLQSNGLQTIQTSTGNLTLATGGGNGNIVLTPNGTGTTTINSSVTATQYTATSTGGSGLRVYGAAGTNQWDIYLNSTNLRFSDNTGTGNVVFDRPVSGTSATLSSTLKVGGATGNFLIDSYTTSKIGIRSWTDIAGITNNFFVQNNASFNYGILGVVSANGTATGDIYGLGYSASAGTSMTPVISWTSNGNVGIQNTDPQARLHIGAALLNSADATNGLILKQTSTNETTGIYLERSAERKGYYIYVGGSFDSLNFQRNNAGTKSDTLTLTRDGHVGINQQNPTGLGGPTFVVAGSGYPEVIVEKTGSNARKWGFTVGSDGSYLLRDYTSGANVFTVNTSGGANFSNNVTVGGNTVWTSANDGSGSGLDADLLDGRDSGGYMTQVQGGIEFLQGSYTGWYKLARSSQASGGAGLRGAFKIIVAATGNYLNPTQDTITGFKDWTTNLFISSIESAGSSIFQNYRITYDSDYSYLEGYISYYFGGSQSIVINSYVNGLNGLTWSPYTGTVQVSSTSSGAVSIGKVGTGLSVAYLRSASGIQFGSGTSTLNYYEEGSFTPSNVGSNMASVSVVFGKYVRIGNQVTVNVRWFVSPGGTGQKYLVFNLPFAFLISSSIGYTGAVSNYNNGLSAYSSNVGTTVRNSSGSDTQQYVEAVFTTNADTTMHLSMTYFTF